MLVRILSNIASFLGNARHRAILVSCLVLVFATASVVGILAMHESQARNAATFDSDTSEREQQEDTIWLGERKVDSKDTLDESSTSADKQPEPDKDSADKSVAQATSEAVIGLSSTDIILPADKLSGEISAGVSGDNKEDVWKLTLSSKNPDLKIANSQTSDKIFTFQLQSTKNIKPGKHQVTVVATNSDGQELTTTLTVTVPDTEDDAL